MKQVTLTEHQFHVIWTAAVGKKGYNKRLFQEVFEELIEEGKVIPTKLNKDGKFSICSLLGR